MNSSNLHVGAVFQLEWDTRPIRVIASDDEQVMYDSWFSHSSVWGIDSLNRSISYFRMPLSLLLTKSKYLRTDEFTKAELSVHRPELPFGFARCAELEWPSIPPAAKEDFPGKSYVARFGAHMPILDTAKLYLLPFGPKGSGKTGVLLESESSYGFTV